MQTSLHRRTHILPYISRLVKEEYQCNSDIYCSAYLLFIYFIWFICEENNASLTWLVELKQRTTALIQVCNYKWLKELIQLSGIWVYLITCKNVAYHLSVRGLPKAQALLSPTAQDKLTSSRVVFLAITFWMKGLHYTSSSLNIKVNWPSSSTTWVWGTCHHFLVTLPLLCNALSLAFT